MASAALPAIRNIYCLGRNYAAHARELGNPVSDEPLIFMKPASAIVPPGGTVRLPARGRPCHHEVELALILGEDARFVTEAEGLAAIAGYAIAIDLTLRGLQGELKAKGHPWEAAKAWDGSLPLSAFTPAAEVGDPDDLELSLMVNGALRQRARSSQMSRSVGSCVAAISALFALRRGDVILTGTPEGVAGLEPGDEVLARIEGLGELRVDIADEVAGAC